MRLRPIVPAAALAALLAGCAVNGRQADSADVDPAPIRAAEREMIAALESSDPTAWVAHYTEDALFLEAGGPPVEGRAALLKLAKAMPPLSSVQITPLRTERHGDLAVVYCTGTWVNGRPPNAGSTSRVRGVLVWRRGEDGRWRISKEVLVPDGAPQR
jgi:uncharacterized protein (TIGR02246 family)